MSDHTETRTLRLWPGVVAVVLQWSARFALPALWPETLPFGVMAALAGGLAVMVWWAFFSRAPRAERWGGLALMLLSLVLTSFLVHESVATAMMGMMFPVYALPVLSLAVVLWALVAGRLGAGPRRATLAATVLVARGGWALVRTGGFTGDLDHDFAWRWAPTAEERLLAGGDGVVRQGAAGGAGERAFWPGFRGPGRDAVLRGVHIDPDWGAAPPVELWRRPVGPGWSSFAVHGGRVYTQEQRGEDEAVSCYSLAGGELLWRHSDPARFWEANAGAGPRATPSYADGRVYTLGATGLLNALDAADGTLLWRRDAATDARVEMPGWGFAGSPLVLEDRVVVAVAGRLAAYRADDGEPLWLGPDGGGGYSSPHWAEIGGVGQVLLMHGGGATSVDPADGKVLWQHDWTFHSRIVQPVLVDGGLLVSEGEGNSLRRLAVEGGAGGWGMEERWTSRSLKPYFNDLVVDRGYAYGFDGSILACVDLQSGKRQWKGGRYGHGQILLLADQDLLLVLSEKGELVLVKAQPEKFSEVARFKAIEGKTWNHPVLAGDVLLVRNGEEMAAFKLRLLEQFSFAGR